VTETEAKQVATIVASADNYCSSCYTDLAVKLQNIWPEYPWLDWVMEAERDYWGDVPDE
jgi:hypothetical protein